MHVLLGYVAICGGLIITCEGQTMTVNTTQNVIATEGQSVELSCNIFTSNTTNETSLTVTNVAWYRNVSYVTELLYAFNETSGDAFGALSSRIAGVVRGLVYVLQIGDIRISDEGVYYCNVSGYFYDSQGIETVSSATANTLFRVMEPTPCASNPCQVNMVCVENESNYSCVSQPKCSQLETDECQSNPCQNGGTCVDMCAAYNCQCPVGYKGAICTEPCENIASMSNDSRVLLGSSHTLSCTPFSSHPIPWWSTSNDGDPVLHMGNDYLLQQTTAGHDGVYYCFVTDNTCISRRSMRVNVFWHVQPNKTEVSNVTLEIGDTYTQVCNVNSTPTATLAWYWKRLKPLTVDQQNGTSDQEEITISQVGQNSTLGVVTLQLTDVQPSDSGTYTCTATSSVDVTYTVISVAVVIADEGSAESSASSGSMPSWQIAVIVIGCLLLVVVLVLVIICVMKKKSAVRPEDKSPSIKDELEFGECAKQVDQADYKGVPDRTRRESTSHDIFMVDHARPRQLPELPPGRGGKLPPLEGTTSCTHKPKPMSAKAVLEVKPCQQNPVEENLPETESS